jgi:hypothetical protein
MVDILTSIRGRLFGLAPDGRFVFNRSGGGQDLLGPSPTVTVSSAQLLALNATPKTLVAAPGAGFAIIPKRVLIYKPAGTAYAGVAAGEDLVLKYTDGSGAQCSSVIETTGFLDQATAQTRVAHAPGSMTTVAGDYTPVANAALVLHLLSGEIITGTSPLYVKVWYDVVQTVFTA